MGDVIERHHTLEGVQSLLTDPTRSWEECASHNPEKDAWAVEGCTQEAGNGSWTQALDMSINGWVAGVPKLDTQATASIQTNMRPKPIWDVAGSECDVAAYLAGEPESMMDLVRTRRPSPVVRIGVDRCVAGRVPASRIESVGRQIVILVESLRLAGIPADVTVCAGVGSWGSKKTIDTRVCVQQANRPVDVARLAFWVAHPSALRRVFFGLWETESYNIRKTFEFGEQFGSGYGHVRQGHAKDDFDEWAPSPMSRDSDIQEWAAEVLRRRTGATV